MRSRIFNAAVMTAAVVSVFSAAASAAVITGGSPATGLSNTLFLNDATTGGGDSVNITSTASQIASRTFKYDGLTASTPGPGTISITGLAFALNGAALSGTASGNQTLKAFFQYYGADGVSGGTDDVGIGTATITLTNGTAGDGIGFEGANTYYVNFDTPLTKAIDGANNIFRVSFQMGETGTMVVKTSTSGTAQAFSNAKLSVAGTFVADTPEPASLGVIAGMAGVLVHRRRRHSA